MDLKPHLRKIIIAAICFHVCIAILVQLGNRIFPLSRLFPDREIYQGQIQALADAIKTSGVSAWFFALVPLHIKLYTLCYMIFARLGLSTLVYEPLNALLFIAILFFVFNLGRITFDAKTGLVAAAIVALWPSFLVTTTQPLKDPLFIALALGFLTINLLWLKKSYLLPRALLHCVIGLTNGCLLWVVKGETWNVMIAIQIMTLALLLARTRERRVSANILGSVLLIISSLVIPRVAIHLYQPAIGWAEQRGVASLDTTRKFVAEPLGEMPAFSWAARIAQLRHRFIAQFSGAGSSIDTNVEFRTTADIMRYLPRATAIGCLAPFPNMWFASGLQNGRLGRIVGGLETLALYFMDILAMIALWNNRRSVSTWWLVLASLIGMIALGLVVTNVGALFRMRYLYVMLIVILAVEGLRILLFKLRFPFVLYSRPEASSVLEV